MSSRQEEEPGPSGLTVEEILTMLGVEMSDSEKEEETNLLCPEEMGDNEEDEICNDLLDRFERQRAFQTNLLQQSGAGGLDASVGTFDFELQPYVDRLSNRMGCS